ncbi:MAG TPA: 50S ribosomal protein L30e, partial [Thermoplasmata archaeon]|nr:50S ribosomal protein L30e [Thermoplasmata archaeon]
LKVALETGVVKIGVNETMASAEAKKARLVIVSKSCPKSELVKGTKIGKIPIYHYEGTALELGAACGRPYPISALAVLDPGSSAILTLESGA